MIFLRNFIGFFLILNTTRLSNKTINNEINKIKKIYKNGR